MRMAAPPDWTVTRQKVRQQLEDALTRIHMTPARGNAIEELESKIYAQSGNNPDRYIQSVKNVLHKASLKRQYMIRQAQNTQQIQQQPSQAMPAPPIGAATMQQNRPFPVNQPINRVGPPSDSPQNIQTMQSPLPSTGYSLENRMPHPSPGQQFYQQRILQRPPQPQQQNVQQPPLRMPDSPYQSTPHGSVGSTYIPSLSPAHPNNSPQVASMSPALRTPGGVTIANSPAGIAAPSPSTNQTQTPPPQNGENVYVEKLKQLQKYIEPLSRMINKQKENSKDLSKMKSLRDVLMDPTRRLPMPTLLKCEDVLQSWLDKPSQTAPTTRSDQHMCQPILDAVAANINSSMMNHTLKRTFSEALQVLDGEYRVPPNVCCKRPRGQKTSEPRSVEPDIRVPELIQGEIARLGSKFKVTVDFSRSSNSGALHLICRLEDPSMPAVPPIRLLVPGTYPKEGPEWESWDCESNNNSPETTSLSFLEKLKPCMETHINNAMDHNETISSMLTAWERSVRATILCQVKVTC